MSHHIDDDHHHLITIVNQAEILLESYLGDVNEVIMKWELLKEEMQNTEDFVQMKLDMARNKLLTIGKVHSSPPSVVFI